VDIDVVFVSHNLPREEALRAKRRRQAGPRGTWELRATRLTSAACAVCDHLRERRSGGVVKAQQSAQRSDGEHSASSPIVGVSGVER